MLWHTDAVRSAWALPDWHWLFFTLTGKPVWFLFFYIAPHLCAFLANEQIMKYFLGNFVKPVALLKASFCWNDQYRTVAEIKFGQLGTMLMTYWFVRGRHRPFKSRAYQRVNSSVLMRTLSENDRNTIPRGWVRQAVMGVLRWKDAPSGRGDTLGKSVSLQVNYTSTDNRFIVFAS